jgi:hypothetical protein
MSIKSKVLATAATLTVVGGVLAAGTIGAGPARAETPSCGAFNFFCIDVFSKQFGTHKDPGFLMDVFQQGARVGQPIILFRVSSGDPALDFTVDDLINPKTFSPYTVKQLAAMGVPFAAVTASEYANSPAVEFEYSPYGVNSGLCVGLATGGASPTQGEGVTLENCGVTTGTLWIINASNPIQAFTGGYTALINGANANFSHQYALTYPTNGYPTDEPRPQLYVHTVETFSQGYPYIVTNQLWGADFGTVPGT